MLDLKPYFDFMDQVAGRYGISPDDIIVVPNLGVPGRATREKLLFSEFVVPEKTLPIRRTSRIEDMLLSRPTKLVEFLVLHEIYHFKNHSRNLDELTNEERIQNDFDADEWALKEMGLM